MAQYAATFGREIRDKEFLLDPTSIHINQGAWGTSPRTVFEAQQKLRKSIEFAPDTFYRWQKRDMWLQSLETVCRFLKLKPKNCTFVENATQGINTALKSLPLKPGDQILCYTWQYKAIQNAAARTAEMFGCEVVTLEIRYPINSREEVIEKYRCIMQSHPRIKVAILDYISGPTATLFPMQELVALCKEHNVISMIDGAQTPCHVELWVEEMEPDFWTGNLHKWGFCPRPVAILWVNTKHQDIVAPLNTSNNYKKKPWNLEFIEQGTRDHSSFLTSPIGIEFIQRCGGREGITEYVTPLLEKAVDHLVKKWGTRRFDIPHDMEAPFMKMIRLPDSNYYMPTGSKEVLGKMRAMMHDLYTHYNVHTTVLAVQDEPWIRLCATIYNSFNEYEKLGDAVLALVADKPLP